MSAQEHDVKEDGGDATFDRAKLPMVIAAVGVTAGLAIAGSVERTAGGAIVIGAWMVGIFALHRLGRAGASPPERPRSPVLEPASEVERGTEPEPGSEPESASELEPVKKID